MQFWNFRGQFFTHEQMRATLKDMLFGVRDKLQVDEETWYDLKIILHELCCNALDHGKEPVEVFAAVCKADKQLHILVSDSGEGYTPQTTGIVDKNAEHGRGMHIVSSLADDLMFNSAANRVLVRIQL